eukprot:5992859-Prymnesium_polylepis.2
MAFATRRKSLCLAVHVVVAYSFDGCAAPMSTRRRRRAVACGRRSLAPHGGGTRSRAGGQLVACGRHGGERTFSARSALVTFLVSTMPLPSAAAVMPNVFAFARPENLNELTPLRLLASLVRCTPALPWPLRVAYFCFMRKHEVSFTMPHSSSGDALARAMAATAVFCRRDHVSPVRRGGALSSKEGLVR